MLNVTVIRCSHPFCTMVPSFNVEGMKAVYCKQHAVDGVLNVTGRHCSHDSCTRGKIFNVEGSRTEAYCCLHALDSMGVRCQQGLLT